MFEFELSTAPKPFNHPFARSTTLLSVSKGQRQKTLAGRETSIIPFAVMSCQYTKLNFSYQSGLFSYDYFLIKLVPLGDCMVS